MYEFTHKFYAFFHWYVAYFSYSYIKTLDRTRALVGRSPVSPTPAREAPEDGARLKQAVPWQTPEKDLSLVMQRLG